MPAVIDASQRRKDFKKSIGDGDGRRRRGEVATKIRKNKREEGLAKRRNFINNFTAQPDATDGSAPAATVDSIPAFVTGLSAADPALMLESTRGLRKLLSAEVNPPVVEVMQSGAVPILAGLLQNTNESIQFEAAWALTNIASTEHTQVVVEAGAVPSLVALLQSQNADVREQCAWCIGNISGDSVALRDMLLAGGALSPLLMNIMQPSSQSMLRNTVWTLSNFCRGKPATPIEVVRPAIPVLAHVLQCPDKDVLMDACWATSYLSDGDDERIQAVVDGGLIPLLVHHLGAEQQCVVTPALRAIGNVVSGNDVQTQTCVDYGAIPRLVPLLSSGKKTIRKESCWAISNISAGSRAQIQSVLNVPNLIESVLYTMIHDDWDVRKEAAWVISNICTGGSADQVESLAKRGVIPAIVELLDVHDSKIVLLGLEALSAVLKVGEERGHDYVGKMEEAGGVEKVEELQTHAHEEVYQAAIDMIERYLGAEEDENENLAPVTTAGDKTFAFGVSTPVGGTSAGGFALQPPIGGFNFGGGGNAPLGESYSPSTTFV